MQRLSRLLVILFAVTAVLNSAAKAQLQISLSAAWQTFSDKFAGGTSSGRAVVLPNGSANLHHAVRMEGQLTHYFISPFAGMQTNIEPNGSPQDAQAYSGVQFWVRGDGHRYLVQVHTASVKDYNYFSEPFATTGRWVLVRAPFKNLTQMIPGGKKVPWTGSDLTGMGFEASGFVGRFWMEVGKISLYR
ncbi:MAG: CIA30 family protein [Candidatus Acidiferrales bacterium]